MSEGKQAKLLSETELEAMRQRDARCSKIFAGGPVKVDVVSDYPLWDRAKLLSHVAAQAAEIEQLTDVLRNSCGEFWAEKIQENERLKAELAALKSPAGDEELVKLVSESQGVRNFGDSAPEWKDGCKKAAQAVAARVRAEPTAAIAEKDREIAELRERLRAEQDLRDDYAAAKRISERERCCASLLLKETLQESGEHQADRDRLAAELAEAKRRVEENIADARRHDDEATLLAGEVHGLKQQLAAITKERDELHDAMDRAESAADRLAVEVLGEPTEVNYGEWLAKLGELIDRVKQQLADERAKREGLERVRDEVLRIDRVAYPSRQVDAIDRLARQIEKMHEAKPKRPLIVCLCGSTRFMEAFQQANLQETLAGRIILSIGCNTKADGDLFKGPDADEIKQRLDALHKRKIDLADEVLVLDVGGYIGDSTRSEIEHAKATGKSIRYLSQEQPAAPSAESEQPASRRDSDASPPFRICTLGKDAISQGRILVRRQWGDEYATHFQDETSRLLDTPYIQLLGAYVDGSLVGLAVLAKSQMDFAYWSITWVVVETKFQSKGIGNALILEAERLAIEASGRYPGSGVILQLTTDVPEFYEKLGYESVHGKLMVKEIAGSSSIPSPKSEQPQPEQPEFVCPKCGGTEYIESLQGLTNAPTLVIVVCGSIPRRGCGWRGTWAEVRAAKERE